MLAHGISIKLGQLLWGHFLSLCCIFVPAFLVNRTNFGSKVLWVGWHPYHSTLGTAWLQKVTISESISPFLGISAKAPPHHRFLGSLTHPRSLTSSPYGTHPCQLMISIHSPYPLALFPVSPKKWFTILTFPSPSPFPPNPYLHLPPGTILFFLLVKFKHPCLGLFSCLASLGLWNVWILYFMANIYL